MARTFVLVTPQKLNMFYVLIRCFGSLTLYYKHTLATEPPPLTRALEMTAQACSAYAGTLEIPARACSAALGRSKFCSSLIGLAEASLVLEASRHEP